MSNKIILRNIWCDSGTLGQITILCFKYILFFKTKPNQKHPLYLKDE